jgi:hypothetical protein
VKNPQVEEIGEAAASFLKLPCVVEDKCYSRNAFVRGRVKIMLFDQEKKLVNPNIKNSKMIK